MDSLIIAFSMYSKIPMPGKEWTERGMKYAICFFPVVGIVIGFIVWLAGGFLMDIDSRGILIPCVMSIIPILITGGIHMDGFLDTMDGISSYQTREKRLEILKDSNSGAFAIIGGLVYMVLTVGAWSELSVVSLPVIAAAFCMSRAMSGLCLVQFPQARKKGLAATFGNGADKKIVTCTMVVFILTTMIFVTFVSVPGLIILIISAVLSLAFHYYNCMHNFGGITGDLAGFFLQLFELMVLLGCVMAEMAGVI